MKYLPGHDECIKSADQPCMNQEGLRTQCDGFLCGKECKDIAEWAELQSGNINMEQISFINFNIIMKINFRSLQANKLPSNFSFELHRYYDWKIKRY